MHLEKHPQAYYSVTIWQGEPEWQIEIRIGGFPSIAAAANFGYKHAKKLKHEPNVDYLILLDSSGSCHKVEQEQVFVYKIKPESQEKLMVSEHDFTLVDVRIENFSSIDGLNRGFAGLAYGVLDTDLIPIKI